MTRDPLQKIRLGRTDLFVTPISFGAAALGDIPRAFGYSVDAQRAEATVKAIFDSPINFLDTSRNYGLGRAEERIGAVIRERGLPPDFVLATKLDRDFETDVFDAARARRSLEESLQALGVDHVDILFLHDPEHARSFGEATGPFSALSELFRMKEEGLCRAVGLAAGDVEKIIPLLQDWNFDVLITHNRFTLANRNADAMIDLGVARGVSVINGAPYAGGVLAKGASAYRRYVYQPATDARLDPIRRIEEICVRNGVPPGAAALQFSMRDKRIASTLCGVSKPERVAETLAWARFPIPDAVWEELAALPYSSEDPEATRQKIKLG